MFVILPANIGTFGVTWPDSYPYFPDIITSNVVHSVSSALSSIVHSRATGELPTPEHITRNTVRSSLGAVCVCVFVCAKRLQWSLVFRAIGYARPVRWLPLLFLLYRLFRMAITIIVLNNGLLCTFVERIIQGAPLCPLWCAFCFSAGVKTANEHEYTHTIVSVLLLLLNVAMVATTTSIAHTYI